MREPFPAADEAYVHRERVQAHARTIARWVALVEQAPATKLMHPTGPLDVQQRRLPPAIRAGLAEYETDPPR